MNAIDLLDLEGAPHEEVLADMLATHGCELHFNGRLVWGDIVAAIVAGRKTVAMSSGLDEAEVTPHKLDVAIYHPEENALYVAVDYRLPARSSGGAPLLGRAERRIVQGPEPRTIEQSAVSTGTAARMLELMDVIDLSRAIWLPLRT